MIIDKFEGEDIFDQFANKMQQQVGHLENIGISSFELSYSKTKTSFKRLNSHFQKCLEDVNNTLQQSNTTLYTLCLASQLFLMKLQEANIYKQVNLYFYPVTREVGQVGLHFDIYDKQPYFFSASNELDMNGALFAVKVGKKNFLGLEDQIIFEYEKNLSQAKLDWNLGWNYKTVHDNNFQLNFKQSESLLYQQINEASQEISLQYKCPKYTLSIGNYWRSNKCKKYANQNEKYIQNEFLNNLDFLPSKQIIAGGQFELKNTIYEQDNIQRGSKIQCNTMVGLPILSSNPFIKLWMSHHYNKSFEDYRKIYKPMKELIRNTSLSFNMTYGVAYSRHRLLINDMFNHLNYRGFNQIIRENQKAQRNWDSFVKFDWRLNFQNNKNFHSNINLFYYLSLMSIGQPASLIQNIRSSTGIGLSMPLGTKLSLEALIPLYNKAKQHDQDTHFQIRIQYED